jgi:hypothetical protein
MTSSEGMRAIRPQGEWLVRELAERSGEVEAEVRASLEELIAREVVDGAIVTGRRELMRIANVRYSAFVDPSGGSSDSMTLAIAHLEKSIAVLDALRE